MKKILCLFAAAFFSLCAFAEPKGTGLTDGDVKSWAKNLSAIQTELDAIGVDKDDVASASKKDREKAVKVLNGYGITGANCIEKFIMINQCSAVIVAESELSSADPQSLSMMKAMGIDPLAQLKAGVNSKDYKVVEANKKAVAAAVKGFAETASDSSSKGQEPYEDYDPAK